MKKAALVTILTMISMLMVTGCSISSISNSNREDIAEETEATAGSASNSEELSVENADVSDSTSDVGVETAKTSDSTSDAGDVGSMTDEEFFASLPEWDEEADPRELYKKNQLKEECVFYTRGETSFDLEVPSVRLHLSEYGTIEDQVPYWKNPVLDSLNYITFKELPAVFRNKSGDEFMLLAVITDRSLIKVDFNYDKITKVSNLGNYDLWKVDGSEIVKPLREATLARVGDMLTVYSNSDKLASVKFDLGNEFFNVSLSNYFFTSDRTLLYVEIPEDYSYISPQVIAYDCIYSGDWQDILCAGSLVVSPIFAYSSNPNELYAVIPEEIPKSWGAYESLHMDNFKIVPLDDSNFTCYFFWGNDMLSWHVTYCYSTMETGIKLYYTKLISEVDNNFVNLIIQDNKEVDPASYEEQEKFDHLEGIKPSEVNGIIHDLVSFLDNWENSHPEEIYKFFKDNPGQLVDFKPEYDNWYGGHRWLEAHPEYKEELQELLNQELLEE